MQNDEDTLDTQEVNQESETVEETVSEEVQETTEEAPEESIEEKLARAEADAAKYRRLFEKAKKPASAPQPASPLNVEETVLLANGMSEELMTELKAVAAVRKVSLIKAQTDPIFVAVKDKFEKDQKREDASLPASRGSGNMKPKKDFSTPGLSREEHMALVKANS